MLSTHCRTGPHHRLCHLHYGSGRCECPCHDNPAHLASTSLALRPEINPALVDDDDA